MKENKDFAWEKWIQGIPYEVAFWNNVYRWKHTFKGLMGWSHYGNEIQLEQFDVRDYLASLDSPKVLDVGCGLSYATGNLLDLNGQLSPIDIHYVDPLAFFFNKIIKRYGKKLPPIEFGMIEYLSAFYPNHDVDLVIIQNALDHSSDPLKGIYEAADVLKIGGVLYLNHHPNEAETEHYKGFHQYNISNNNGHLLIWNTNSRWDVDTLIAPFASITTIQHDNGHIVSVITKKDSIPSDLLKDKSDKSELSSRLMLQVSHQSFWYSLWLKWKYWCYNIMQFFVQALPWNVKMYIKRMIKQA